MSEQRWNPEQLQAITARGSDLLVAAAAGSGKTAVLVERLLRRVTEEGCDVDRFLVVTFTRAAAAEMLEKFSRRLTALAAQDPENRRLRRQLRLLSRAHINTVHGFCSAFLRERFQGAGLPPDFRVLDADEADTLLRATLAELLESRYENESESFNALSDALSDVRDDSRLEETILSLHSRMSAHPHPEQWAESMQELAKTAAETDPTENVYGKALLENTRHTVRYHLSRYEQAIRFIMDNPALERCLELFQLERDTIRELSDVSEIGGWDEIRGKLFHIAFARMPAVKNSPETEEGKQLLKAVRDGWKAAVTNFQTRIFAQDAAEIREDAAAVQSNICELAQCAVDLDTAYTEAKRRRSCVDFSDLEHLTLKLLQNADGSPSQAARELSEEYVEIMVDEYQDTNAVQDAIFQTLARNNLFTVGDMKQSIYRFRLADPSIFLARYNKYPDMKDADGKEARRIILSRNYRSRPDVLNSCNRLFAAIFSPAAGELEYTPREYLYPGREFPETTADTATELVMVETVGADDEENDDGASAALQEARWVASQIREMVLSGYPVTDGDRVRPAHWGDFAILLRSFSTRSAIFAQALDEYNIPLLSEHSIDLFDTPEASLVLAALDCVDNPRQDIALTALMRSPLFAFTADELAALRLVRTGTFWQAVFAAAGRETGDGTSVDEAFRENAVQSAPLSQTLRVCQLPFQGSQRDESCSKPPLKGEGDRRQAVEGCQSHDFSADGIPDTEIFRTAAEKAKSMLSLLDSLRRDVETLPLGRALWHICDRTGIFTSVSAMKYADTRRANLYALFEYAYRFERAGYRGLYRFLEQIRRIRQSGKAPGAEGAGGKTDSVRIMSVHKSKGLQFPIVFVSGCGGRFNDQSLSEPILVHPQLGLGLRRRLPDLRVEYPTAAYNAIRTVLKREERSEEMRVLYVAMTRAEEKLFLTASVRNAQKLLDKAEMTATELPCPARALLDSGTALDWLLQALLPEDIHFPTKLASGWRIRTVSAPACAPADHAVISDVSSEVSAVSDTETASDDDFTPSPELSAKLLQTVTAHYAHETAVNTPSKLTATQIRGNPAEALLDPDAAPMPEIFSEDASERVTEELSEKNTTGNTERTFEEAAEKVSDETAPTRRWNRPHFLMERGLTAAERGTALHMAMQFADYARCQTVFDCRLELERLERQEFLTHEQVSAVDPRRIVRFFQSDLGRRLLASREIHREFRFSLPVAPKLYENGVSALEKPTGNDAILLQGVIDCWFAEENGIVIIDFKTDYVPKRGAAAIMDRYRPQVTAYAHALGRITGRTVKECGLYLFYSGETIYYDV